MKNLLSIGKVSKITGVSIKSLRYYEKIGVLYPTYVNPQTGYRYYTVEQLLMIELILIFVELGIPLKNFENYMTTNQEWDIQKLVYDGTELVNQKIKKLKNTQQFLNHLSAHINRTNIVKNIGTSFIETIPKRYFLITRCEQSFSNYTEVHTQYSKLMWQATSLGIPDQFNQGFFMVEKNGIYERYIFLEISNPSIEIENLYVIPSGTFCCHVVPFSEFFTIQPKSKLCIVQELFDVTVNAAQRDIEIQEMQFDND